MGSTAERKEAIRKFKEKKTLRGAFALRCAATGTVWVGSSPNLEATRNRFWFGLRHGSHPDRAVQAEWNAHGEHAFQYEILEILDDDLIAISIPGLLKEKRLLWIERLGARPL
jgi:hypothetical protein